MFILDYFDDVGEDIFFHPSIEQQMIAGSSAPLFAFNATASGPRRNWRDSFQRDRFLLRLEQVRAPTRNDNMGCELTEALRRVIRQRIDNDSQVRPHHYVHFTMQSDKFTHFPVGEFFCERVSRGKRPTRCVPSVTCSKTE